MDYLFWGHVSVWLFIGGYAVFLMLKTDSLRKKLKDLSNKG